jgi:pyruvate/2-oxoglutarate/acetoin dehydrogenase E1 component
MSGSHSRVALTHDFTRTLVGTVRDMQDRDARLLVIQSRNATEIGPPGVLQTLADDVASVTPALPRAIGLALAGRRPLVDATGTPLSLLLADLEAIASLRFRTGGIATIPMVILARIGGRGSAHYERCQWGALCRIAGLKVAVPATSADLDEMLRSSLRERGPVVLLLDGDLLGPPWGQRTEWQSGSRGQSAPQPLVRARVVLPGDEVTLVTLGAGVELAHQGIRRMRARAGVELIDLRVLAPWDRDTVLASVEKTGRLVVVDEDGHGFGLASEIMASVAELHPPILQAPPQRVTRADVPTAPTQHLITPTLPTPRAISAAITRVMSAAPRAVAEPA